MGNMSSAQYQKLGSQENNQTSGEVVTSIQQPAQTEINNKTIVNKDKSQPSILKMNLNKEQYKIINVLIFIFFFCFLMNVLFKILDFYDVDVEQSYSYIIWFSLLFLLFIVLPSKRSVFDDKYKKNDNNTVNNN